jgi:DNA-directed RNA polymerase alpha subunit
MDRIDNINITNNIVTALFRTKDVAEVNLLKRAIWSQVYTYAIDVATFHTNNSPRHDEVIALRLGQLVIDNTRFVPPENGDYKIRIDVEGPLEVTTDHIPELPFKFVTPLVTLRKGQRIVCDCVVKIGQGKTHVKWRPISTFTFTEVEDGYQIKFKEIGMLTGPEIIQKGLEKMEDAARSPSQTIFSHTLVPHNMQ